MNKLLVAVGSGLLILGMASAAMAETPLTPKAQYAAESKKAQTRYDADKKLCNDETSSNARLQCRRDAKTEYDKAIASAKTQMQEATGAKNAKEVKEAKPSCTDCGKVVAVGVTEKEGEGGPVGMIAGGVTGAILGRQVGSGLGKDLATIAGAAGGAYAGKKIEEKVRTHKVWTVNVQYADGSKSNYEFKQDPGYKVGEQVKKSGDTIARY